MFNVANIAIRLNMQEATVREHLAGIIYAIRSYTNRGFISSVSVADEFDFYDNTITCKNEDFSRLYKNDLIEVFDISIGSSFYVVVDISNDYSTITVDRRVVEGTFKCRVIKLTINVPDDVIISMLNVKMNGQKAGIKSESLDGYSYTLKDEAVSFGYPISVLQQLNHMRRLPGSIAKEYFNAGYY